MKRKLLRQISNEWKSNVWLCLELLIVSVVLWFIIDTLYVYSAIYNEPRGFDTEHCYLVHYAQLSEGAQGYKEYENWEQRSDDMLRLYDRIAGRPEVEAVTMGNNSYLYNGRNGTGTLSTDTFETRGWVIRRFVSPEFPIVFRVHGSHGETPEQLAEMLGQRPYVMLCSENLLSEYGKQNMDEFIGRKFYERPLLNDSLTLAGIYKTIRYGDYFTGSMSKSIMISLTRPYYAGYMQEMVVRVKDNMDHNFIENIMNDAARDLRFGNYYISHVESFKDIRNNFQRAEDAAQRNRYVVMGFLAVNIFLGLLGTFWFRTQTRVPEIAIRMANGASRADIFRRVVGEGELLLLLVTPFAVLLDWLLTHYQLVPWYNGFYDRERFVTCVLVSFVSLAMMILLGTAIPALRAAKVQPATALKEE